MIQYPTDRRLTPVFFAKSGGASAADRCLAQNLAQDSGGAPIGQRLRLAVGVIDQPRVVEAELVQDRGLEVVGGDHVHGGLVAELVGLAVGQAAANAAARQPDRKALPVVVAAG